MNRLSVDQEQIARFVTTMFKHATSNTFVTLRAFYDKGESRGGPAYWLFEMVPFDPARVVARAVACAQWCANHPR